MADMKTGKMELKEEISRDQCVTLLRQCLTALEQHQEATVQVKGINCVIPQDAGERGHFEVEFEEDDGEFEFELTMKWE